MKIKAPFVLLNFSVMYPLPPPYRKATFAPLYSESELQRAVLSAYTKSLFSRWKALSESHDGKNLFDFARRTPQNVDRIHKELLAKTFRFREGIELTFRSHKKERTVYIFPWEERIVDLLLYRVLNRYFHGAFSSCTYAYRYRSFGIDRCQRKIKTAIRSSGRPLFLLKRDISQYFPSMNHQILLAALESWVEKSDYLYELLTQRVKFFFKREESTFTAERGVPFGSAISCFFANLYLIPLDNALNKIENLHFFRYGDDILVLTDKEARAKEAHVIIENTLDLLSLQSKESHHLNLLFGEPISGYKAVQSFRHLGLQFKESGVVALPKEKVRKICNLFRRAFRRERNFIFRYPDPYESAQRAIKVARKTIERSFRSVAIIDYYLKHGEEESQLKEIDRWLAEEILALAFQRGHKKGNFAKIPFAQLRAMGLPSLLHRRKLLIHGHISSSFFDFGRGERYRRKGRSSCQAEKPILHV